MRRENLEAVVPTLHELNFSAKPFGHQDQFEVDQGPAKLNVYVTRAIRPDWVCVIDRGGWVDRKPVDRISGAINSKAGKLPQYRESADLEDVRLLVVANRIMNSGTLIL